MQRRNFLRRTGAAVLWPSLLSALATACQSSHSPKVLVLGGTNFVGPAIVEALLKQNYQVTLLNRGQTNPDLFSELPHIQADRLAPTTAYQSAQKQHWQVVIDVWPQDAQLVDDATQALQNHTDHYVFISSIAVYKDFQEVGLHEASQVVDLPSAKTDWYYSEHKVHAEQLVRERFPDRHTILRPGPIKGWRDSEVDLLYWLLKLQQQQELLAPGTGEDPLQFIDVKDVGRFVAQAIDQHWSGTYNLTGPRADTLLWKEFLGLAKAHFGVETELYWPSEAFLRAQQVRSYEDLPLWAPLSEDRGFMQISNNKVAKLGFVFRPIEETLNDCMAWVEDHPPQGVSSSRTVSIGLDAEREKELISLWKSI